MKKKLLPHLCIFILITQLYACGSSGGASPTDSDADGIKNTLDIDDDNDGLIEIASLEQLDWMRNDVLGTTQTDNDGNVKMEGCPNTGCNGYELITDLDFDTNGDGVMNSSDTYFDYDGDGQNNGWLPVGDEDSLFETVFEGNGHRISNLYINRGASDTQTAGSQIGLFGYVTGSVFTNIEIRNLVLDGPLMQITGENSTGGLIGRAGGSLIRFTISNITTSGNVTGGNKFTGGLAGLISITTIINCSASGNVTGGNESTGGLVGLARSSSDISNSYASGNVTSSNFYTGGLVGKTEIISINNSYASGSVTSRNFYTGGLVGLAIRTDINNSYATSTVEGTQYTGGLVGSVNFNTAPATDLSVINNSFSTGTVSTDNYSFVGGLIGLAYHLNLNNSFTTGAVSTSHQYVGGLIGNANTATNISYSFAANSVMGNFDVGALTGYSDGAVYVDNYFASDLGQSTALGTNQSSPGTVNPAGTTGDTLTNLQAVTSAGSSLFTNWGSKWDFGSNNQLPGLVIDGVVFRDGDANGVLD